MLLVMDEARLVVITGIMASGKSTIAQALAERLPASAHVRGDHYRRSIVNGRRRTIRRDGHVDARNRMVARMSGASSKAKFNRRSWVAETPFAYVKGTLGLRQFRHAGLEKVEQEWRRR